MTWEKVLITIVICLGLSTFAFGGSVGDIQAFYNSSDNFGMGVLDGTVFVFQNTSGTAITDGVFNISGDGYVDSFNLGTIGAGDIVFIEPGLSNDGGSGHTFFAFTGTLRDESEQGPNGNDVQFWFTGLQGTLQVTSGIFTPGETAGPSNDGTVPDLNFLGGPGNNDALCNDCFGPKIVGNLSTEPGTTPEPSSIALFGSGILGIAGVLRRKVMG